MKRFQLNRKEDVSGISGIGIIAEGVVFHDGQVVLSWFGQHHTVEILPDISSVEAIHGHGGTTAIEYTDPNNEGTLDGGNDCNCANCTCRRGADCACHD